jgi:hypothetical protein
MKSGWKELGCHSHESNASAYWLVTPYWLVTRLPWRRYCSTGAELIRVTELEYGRVMACERASEHRRNFSRHLSLSPEFRASSTRLDVPFSPESDVPFSQFSLASCRPPKRMGFSGLNEVGGHLSSMRHRRWCRTTSESDFGNVVTLPRSYPTRPISPTRNNNPQPVGLVFQSPYNKTGKVL